MRLSWFDAKEAKAFGESLARFCIERTSKDMPNIDKKAVAKKQEELLNKMALQVDQFKQTHKLNIYKKAQLGNVFKWTLREAGYDSAYIDRLTNWLMVRF